VRLPFWRKPSEKRYNGFTASFTNPPIPLNSETTSYQDVNLTRAETSLQQVAVWAAVNLIARLGSNLPVDVFAGTGSDRRELRTPTWLLDPAGDGYGYADWAYQYLVSNLLRGNVYGRQGMLDRLGYPQQVVLFHPDDVHGWRDSTGPHWRVLGTEVPNSEMWHRRTYPMPGCLQGMSPISYHAMTIGLSLTAERFGAQWFRDGGHPSALLARDDEDLDEDQARVAKSRFMASTRGTREPVVLGGGWKYTQIQVAPEESQFLETHRYTAAECARIYGPGMPEVLGYETGGSLTYANVEQRAVDLLKFTLDPWFTQLERDLSGCSRAGST
jgi:HK97 family phage portal protein